MLPTTAIYSLLLLLASATSAAPVPGFAGQKKAYDLPAATLSYTGAAIPTGQIGQTESGGNENAAPVPVPNQPVTVPQNVAAQNIAIVDPNTPTNQQAANPSVAPPVVSQPIPTPSQLGAVNLPIYNLAAVPPQNQDPLAQTPPADPAATPTGTNPTASPSVNPVGFNVADPAADAPATTNDGNVGNPVGPPPPISSAPPAEATAGTETPPPADASVPVNSPPPPISSAPPADPTAGTEGPPPADASVPVNSPPLNPDLSVPPAPAATAATSAAVGNASGNVNPVPVGATPTLPGAPVASPSTVLGGNPGILAAGVQNNAGANGTASALPGATPSGVPGTTAPNSKRGFSFPAQEPDTTPMSQFFGTGSLVSWWYNWSKDNSSATPTPNAEFVPMIWGPKSLSDDGQQGAAASTAPLVAQGSNLVLGFNEPDQAGQTGAGMDAATAAGLWKTMVDKGRQANPNLQFASPASDHAWLQQFMAAICPSGLAGCTYAPNYLAVHSYVLDAQAFIQAITAWHTEYPTLPIIVTEFACAATGQQATLDQVNTFMDATTKWLDTTEYIYRYAWFTATRDANKMFGVSPANSLIDATGALTALGHKYAGL